jgi:hypothetical protein
MPGFLGLPLTLLRLPCLSSTCGLPALYCASLDLGPKRIEAEVIPLE